MTSSSESSYDPDDELELERQITTNQQMGKIISTLDKNQLNRYELFRRTTFNKLNLKKLLSNLFNTASITNSILIIAAGISKVFIAEIVEKSRRVMEDDKGAIQPVHMREAYRLYLLERKGRPKWPLF